MLRTKTDKVDGALIAHFCEAVRPVAWVPLSPEVKQLQALLRRLESLMEIQQLRKTAWKQQLTLSRASIENHLEYLKESIDQTKELISDHFDQHPTLKEQRDLLTTIPGIASHSAAVLLAEIGTISAYKNARQVAAHAGLTPVERSSGSSVHGKPRLSRMGNARLRNALYWPAQSGHAT